MCFTRMPFKNFASEYSGAEFSSKPAALYYLTTALRKIRSFTGFHQQWSVHLPCLNWESVSIQTLPNPNPTLGRTTTSPTQLYQTADDDWVRKFLGCFRSRGRIRVDNPGLSCGNNTRLRKIWPPFYSVVIVTSRPRFSLGASTWATVHWWWIFYTSDGIVRFCRASPRFPESLHYPTDWCLLQIPRLLRAGKSVAKYKQNVNSRKTKIGNSHSPNE